MSFKNPKNESRATQAKITKFIKFGRHEDGSSAKPDADSAVKQNFSITEDSNLEQNDKQGNNSTKEASTVEENKLTEVDGVSNNLEENIPLRQIRIKSTSYNVLNIRRKLRDNVRHSLIPAFNTCHWPILEGTELRTLPLCTIRSQRALHVAANNCASVDPCHVRTIAREQHFVRLKMARARYRTAWKENKKLRSLAKQNCYHPALFSFAEDRERNPDEFLTANYDYYYSGGNLSVSPDNERCLFVDGLDVNTLNCATLKSNLKLSLKWGMTLPEDTEIFETRFLANVLSEYEKYLYATRQRNTITIRKLEPGNKLKALKYKSDNVPFISFSQLHQHPHIFGVSLCNQEVRIFDLNRSSKVYDAYDLSNEEQKISWNVLKSWEDKKYFYANKNSISLIDLRTNSNEWLSSKYKPFPSDLPCDQISALSLSKFENLFYVGTHHKLLCVDVRMMGENFNVDGAVCEWRHQLKFPPAFMDIFGNNDTEHIALSSAFAGDVRICELSRESNTEQFYNKFTNETPSYLYKSYCLPHQPPTLKELYGESRLKALCLQPAADLRKRIDCCTTGMTFCNLSSEKFDSLVLTSNSNGDVFAQPYKQRKAEDQVLRSSLFDIDEFKKYAREIRRKPLPSLKYTDVKNLKTMRKVFRSTALSKGPNRDEEEAEEHVKSLGSWQKPIEVLQSYKDALVQDMLTIWDLEPTEDKHVSLKQLKKHGRQDDPKTIVESWLGSNRHDIVKPTQSEVITQDFNDHVMHEIPQSTLIVNETIDPDNSTIIMNKTNVSISKQPPKKKTKYIKGF